MGYRSATAVMEHGALPWLLLLALIALSAGGVLPLLIGLRVLRFRRRSV